MKTNHCIHLASVVLGLAVITSALSAVNGRAAAATAEPPAAAADAAAADVTSAKWTDIKDFTYDTRAQFFTGLKRLEAKVDGQISELTARRAAMKGSANTKDWDFAMKEMGNARTHLQSTGEELAKATPETWDQQKDKVGRAWVRTQEAYGKVKSSTTS